MKVFSPCRTAVFLVVFLCGIAPAQSAELIDATQPEEIHNIARGFGSANLETDSVGDPLVVGRIDGTRYRMVFHGCTDGEECASIRFVAAWAVDQDLTDFVMEWNRGKRFGKAYLDGEDDPVLEMDIELEHGVSRDNFEGWFEIWEMLLSAFEMELASATEQDAETPDQSGP